MDGLNNRYHIVTRKLIYDKLNSNSKIEIQLPELDDNNKAVVILSGGLDSTILTHLLYHNCINPEKNITALSFNYNQRHNVELEKAKLTCNTLNINHHIIDIDFLSKIIAPVSALSGERLVDVPTIDQIEDPNQPITYVPFRNALFLMIAASFAESRDCKYIFIGAQSGDLYGYWDCTPDFMSSFNDLISLNRKHKIKLIAPFVRLSKADEISIGWRLGVDFSNTHTCYNGVDELGRSCGKCPTCTERLNNFAEVGLKDPLHYIE